VCAQADSAALGLAVGFTLARWLQAVVNGIANDVNQRGPKGRPTLGVEPRAIRVDLNVQRSLAHPQGQGAGLLGNSAQSSSHGLPA